MRLASKAAIVVGAGRTLGETIGNGRATTILFAREGARVMLVDRDLESSCEAMAAACVKEYGRIDILHNNVGIGAGDAGITRLREDAWNRILDVNLKAMFQTCKHVLPTMREQHSGAIVNISSIAAVAAVGMVAYKVSKAASMRSRTRLPRPEPGTASAPTRSCQA